MLLYAVFWVQAPINAPLDNLIRDGQKLELSPNVLDDTSMATVGSGLPENLYCTAVRGPVPKKIHISSFAVIMYSPQP